MPHNLSRRATMLLLGVAFGLTFTVQMLLSDGASGPEPKAKRSTRAALASVPAAEPELRLAVAGTVPALREPRRPRVRRQRRPKRRPERRPEPTSRVPEVVEAAPTVEPEPLTPAPTVQPAPTAAPRYIPPRPQPKPKPKPVAPKPTPVPTAPPPSGDFDTSGES